jgi:hypothetical protein
LSGVSIVTPYRIRAILAYVPPKWDPVRRQGHAPTREAQHAQFITNAVSAATRRSVFGERALPPSPRQNGAPKMRNFSAR